MYVYILKLHAFKTILIFNIQTILNISIFMLKAIHFPPFFFPENYKGCFKMFLKAKEPIWKLIIFGKSIF